LESDGPELLLDGRQRFITFQSGPDPIWKALECPNCASNVLSTPIMLGRSTKAPAGSQASLLALIRAIGNLDVENASAILQHDPSLASTALVTGASRSDAESFYFERIAHYAYAGDTALHIASAAYLPRLVTELLACGANVSAVNRRGAQPIHYASDGGPTAGRSNEQDQVDVIRALIGHGANANAVDKNGVAPIHRAVRCRCFGVVEALLDSGGDPRLRNGSGSTPLHLAVLDTGRGGAGLPESRDAQIRIVRLLLGRGARFDDRDSRGRTVSEMCDPRLLSI
jgi:ankyrin repeat protein